MITVVVGKAPPTLDTFGHQEIHVHLHASRAVILQDLGGLLVDTVQIKVVREFGSVRQSAPLLRWFQSFTF